MSLRTNYQAKPNPSQIRLRRGNPRAAGLVWASAVADIYGPEAGRTYLLRDAVAGWNGNMVDVDGTLSKSPWGRSLSLSGASNLNRIEYKSTFNVSRYTIGLLINSPSGAASIIQLFDRDDAFRVWQFRLNAGKIEAILFFSGSPVFATGTTDLRDGNWHHVAVTYDQVNIKVYADGILEGTTSSTAVLDSHPERIMLGAGGGTSTPARFADAKLWSRGLSAAEIAAEIHDPFELYRPPSAVRYMFRTTPTLSTGAALMMEM